ncbi:MAG: hypothetical protein ACOZAM_04740 [Pseudomonadota bacterium]
MSRTRPAIEIALDLKAMPSLAKVVRRRPLPPQVTPLIRVAAGSQEQAQAFAAKYGFSENYVREACIFFLHEAVLFTGADSLRTLGLQQNASPDEIREHKRWLLMWLHPDRNENRWETALFQRVVHSAKAAAEPRSIVSPGSPARKPRVLGQRRKIRLRRQARPASGLKWRIPKSVKIAALLLLFTGLLLVQVTVFME